MNYDKFAISADEAEQNNRQFLIAALDALYATYITNDIAARYRGQAIQNINSMANLLGYPDLVRRD